MKTWTITESKAQLSALVESVATTGKPVVIGRAGRPMVQLVPYHPSAKSGRRLGTFKGKIRLAADFARWEGEEARAFGVED